MKKKIHAVTYNMIYANLWTLKYTYKTIHERMLGWKTKYINNIVRRNQIC